MCTCINQGKVLTLCFGGDLLLWAIQTHFQANANGQIQEAGTWQSCGHSLGMSRSRSNPDKQDTLTRGVTLGAYADTERGVMVKLPLGLPW